MPDIDLPVAPCPDEQTINFDFAADMHACTSQMLNLPLSLCGHV